MLFVCRLHHYLKCCDSCVASLTFTLYKTWRFVGGNTLLQVRNSLKVASCFNSVNL